MNVARFDKNAQYIATAGSGNSVLKLLEVDPGSLRTREVARGEFHHQAINDIQWSPCGRYIATGGEDCVLVVWRVKYFDNGETVLEPRRALRGHVAAITSLTWNPRGSLIATGSVDEKVILWNVKGGALYKLFNAHSQPVVSVDFSYDGRLVLTASTDGYLRVWSVVDGMAVRIIGGAEEIMPVFTARFSPNSTFIAATYIDGKTRLIDTVDRHVVRVFSENSGSPPHSISSEQNGFVRDGDPSQSSNANGDVPKTEAVSPREERFMRELRFVKPDLIATGSPDGVRCYDIKHSGQPSRRIGSGAVLGLDINDCKNIGLHTGPDGIEIFRLSLT